jgi:soluble lytic murein transglycosylase-like protein
VNDVGRRTVLLKKLGQLLVDVLIFGSPLFAVLCLKNVILGVVDNSGLAFCAMAADNQHPGNASGAHPILLHSVFLRTSSQYNFDYLMLVAQGYQESLLDQSRKNPSGAVGIMQVIPKNAAAPPINIPNVEIAQYNIEAGAKMLRNIADTYFNDPNLDAVNKTLIVFASYNAGPNRIARLRKQAVAEGLDPNQWFGNVELVVAKDIGKKPFSTSAISSNTTSPIN